MIIIAKIKIYIFVSSCLCVQKTQIMLSKNKIKFIRSLEQRKFRNETGCFLAEGNKTVADMLPYFECVLLVAKTSWLATKGDIKANELLLAGDREMERASLLKNPQDVLAVFKKSSYTLDYSMLCDQLTLALDGIQDPGNLGTIIRIAAWFGIPDIICSPNTVELYNPKVVQATMGALSRVRVHILDLNECMKQVGELPVYGTFPEGASIYKQPLTSYGLIVMGNEGNGITPAIDPYISQRLCIPHFPPEQPTSESLNVAVATAIVCGEFRRREVVS